MRHACARCGREGPWTLGVRHLWWWRWLAHAGAKDCCEEILYVLTLQLCNRAWQHNVVHVNKGVHSHINKCETTLDQNLQFYKKNEITNLEFCKVCWELILKQGKNKSEKIITTETTTESVWMSGLQHWPSVTILSSSGLRIPSRGSSGRVRGVLRPAWDWGAIGELSARGPMSRPAVETHTGHTKTNHNMQEHTHIHTNQPTKYPTKNVIINIDLKWEHVYCLNSLWNAIKTDSIWLQLLGVPVLFKRSVLRTVKRQTGHTNSQ